MARSSVPRIWCSVPTLPPSAISASATARAKNGDADVLEGSSDRRMGLVDGDADRQHPIETLQHGIGDRAGSGLHQAVPLGAERLAGGIDHLIVADGVGELVGARGPRQVDVEDEVEL